MKHTQLSLIVVIGLLCCELHAQRSGLDSLGASCRAWQSSSFEEKIYLHTDRTSYLTGETLWFKAYRTDASLHRFIDWSKILYVEVLDKNNAPVVQSKFMLGKDGSEGSLFLPASLGSGNYTLRAYTNWMKNSGSDFFFHQVITILNPFIPLEDSTDPESSQHYDAQFFPEGGDLVRGLESVVGVRIVDRSGYGISYKGAILNTQNDTVARFTANQFGLSKFSLTPLNQQRYMVHVVDQAGKTYRYGLPESRDSGYVMRVDEANAGQLEITIRSTYANNQEIYLLAHTRQDLKIQEQTTMRNGVASFRINKSALGSGISVLTVFDQNLQARCERLYFRKPETELAIHVRGNPYLIGLREPVKLNVSFAQKSDSLQNGAYSLAVFNIDSLDLPQANIAEYFWLTSDLAGAVQNPGYYFGTETSSLRRDTDLLMLTHGWRKFKWDSVLKGDSKREFLPEIGGHLIGARITEKESNKPADHVPVYLSFMGSPVNTYISQTLSGKALFETEPLYGNRSMIVQADTISKSRFRIDIDDPFFTKASRQTVHDFVLNDYQINSLEQRSIHMQVQNLFYGNTAVQDFKYPFTTFYGRADESYRLDDYTRFPTLEEVLREYVPGVRLKKRKDQFQLSVIDQLNKASFSGDPLVLVDGVPIFSMNKLMAIDPLKLKQLDVIKRRWYLNAMAFDGIVSFTSYTGDLAGFQPPEGALLNNYKGLEQQRQFFSPRYSPDTKGNETLPDVRHVLLWRTGTLQQGSQQVDFFTSDIAGKYKIVIQALTADGLPGYYTTSFVVK